GPTVTHSYDALPDATARAKIAASGAGTGPADVWHRMGDCGYLDEFGRLWFCGRAAERVEAPGGPLFTEQVEPIFNRHPSVRRAALFRRGQRPQQRHALDVDLRAHGPARYSAQRRALWRELGEVARNHPLGGRSTPFY